MSQVRGLEVTIALNIGRLPESLSPTSGVCVPAGVPKPENGVPDPDGGAGILRSSGLPGISLCGRSGM